MRTPHALLAITDLLERETDHVANESNALSLAFVQEITLNSALNEQEFLADQLPFMIRFYLDNHQDLQRFPEWLDLGQLTTNSTGLRPAELILAGGVKDGDAVSVTATKQGLAFNGKVAQAA